MNGWLHQRRPVIIEFGPVRLVLLVVLVIVATVSRLATIAGHTPAALHLLRSAGTCAGAGPLFLRQSCGPGEPRPRTLPRCHEADVQSCYLSALLDQSLGDGETAVSALRQVTQAGYRRPYADVLLAYNLGTRGESTEAATVWRACGGPDCETLLIRAGTRDACGVAAALSDASPRASFCLGALARGAGELDDGIAWFRRAFDGSTSRRATEPAAPAAEHEVSRAEVLYRMGEIELARGRLDEARRLTAECLDTDPEHYWGWFQHALLLAREGNSKRAIQELERLIGRYPAHGAAMLNLGLMYESIGDNKAAEHWFLEARKVLPDQSLADAPLRRVRTTGSLSRQP
jgi:tetratricopeptide (TPR) repeat protein